MLRRSVSARTAMVSSLADLATRMDERWTQVLGVLKAVSEKLPGDAAEGPKP